MRKIILIILLIPFTILDCSKFKGEFAFKKSIDDKYQKPDRPLEFEKDEKMNWVYVFKDVRGKHDIGVALLKKELVWVDIVNTAQTVSETNTVIYGAIENLSDGNYKIVLTERNNVIDEKEFIIFSDEKDYYKYKDE